MGELARKPGAPMFSQTPLEILTCRPGEGYSLVDLYAVPVGGVILSVIGVSFANNNANRPFWSGIHRHVIAGAIAYGCGVLWRNFRMAARAEETAILKHYVTLHPEDFPPFEKRRIKDMFVPWLPIR